MLASISFRARSSRDGAVYAGPAGPADERPGNRRRSIFHGSAMGLKRDRKLARGYESVLPGRMDTPRHGGDGRMQVRAGHIASVPIRGPRFFPSVDAGELRLNVRCPPGTRIEQTDSLLPAGRSS